MRSLLFVTQARETPVVPDGTYDEVEEALIETVVEGLFADSRTKSHTDSQTEP